MTVPSEVKVTTTATRTVSATVQSYIRRDVTASPNNKIVKKRGASKCKPQSPEESALSVIEADAALASSVCGCIELPAGPATVIVTKTPVATDLITTTTTEDVTASTKVTTSPTVTVVVSSTDINVISESSTATSLEFTTATVSTTTTTTAVQQSPVPYCQPGTDYDTPNAGGCFSQTGGVICYCDSDPSGNAVCDTSPACGVACNTDADCADTEFCANGYYADCNSVGRSCISFLGCSSTYVKVAGRDWAAPGGIVARNVSGRPPLQPYPGTELVNHNAE
ncbi:hypothetical protein SBRCBS47491_009572 [Sporothrix bragantina]|uniref:Uncharacterized protein n=1 Tax=Sporothrix bragantina TaxID=671064 RepID=A0ABP0CVU0_9PEZI